MYLGVPGVRGVPRSTAETLGVRRSNPEYPEYTGGLRSTQEGYTGLRSTHEDSGVHRRTPEYTGGIRRTMVNSNGVLALNFSYTCAAVLPKSTSVGARHAFFRKEALRTSKERIYKLGSSHPYFQRNFGMCSVKVWVS